MDNIVNGCSDCPLCAFASESVMWRCFHPTAGGESIAYMDDELTTPEWCPLKTEPITISLKQNNNARN